MFGNIVIYVLLFALLILLITILLLLKRVRFLRKLSETDQITSLMNYRGLCRNIENLISHNLAFSLCIIDIDNFSVFNKHSYKLGDEVLKEFASLLNQSFLEQALIARFRKGDEFIIIFKDTEMEKAKIKIEELKEKCRNYHFSSLENFSIHTIGFSEGITEISTEINTADILFSEAEKSLKENKLQKPRS